MHLPPLLTTPPRHVQLGVSVWIKPHGCPSVSVWQVDPRLADIVASMWFGEGKTAYQRDRILPSGTSQLLINLGADTPAHFARFERLLEIISADDADKAAGRDRYRFYKERGYPLTHHVAA